jgi:hypothetical protein
VRIEVPAGVAGEEKLRPGMSVIVSARYQGTPRPPRAVSFCRD